MSLYIAIAFILLLLTLLVNNEQFWWSFFVTLVSSALLVYLVGVDVSQIKEISASHVITWSVLYLAAGVATSITKWVFVLAKARKVLKSVTDRSVNTGDFQNINEEFWHYANPNMRVLRIGYKDGVYSFTRGRDFNSYVGAWIAWWPFVLVGLMVSDILSKATSFLASVFGSVFERIANLFTITVSNQQTEKE